MKVFILVISFLFFFGSSYGATDCEASLTESVSQTLQFVEENLPQLKRPLNENDYATDRTLELYLKIFPTLKDWFQLFSHDSHWLDLGSGQGLAMLGFLKAQYLGKVTGVTYSVPSRGTNLPTDPDAIPFRGRYQWHEGRFFENIPLADIQKADVITDSMGVLGYSLKIDMVLNKIVRLLKDEGSFHFYYEKSIQVRVDGKTLFLHDYLNTVPGFRVKTYRHKRGTGGGDSHILTIDHSRMERDFVFRFQLVDAEMGMPASRIFEAQ